MTMTNDEIIASGLNPIAGDNPAGASARYEPEFQRLEDEVRKLESLNGGEVNWRLVQDDCLTILGTRSKDLLVVAYLTRALYQSQRLVGLALGLKLCQDVLATFWDNLQPQRVRARRSALEWLSERVTLAITPGDAASPQGQDALAICISTMDAIWAWSQGRFEEEDCGMATLRRRLGELRGGASEGDGAAAPAAGGASPAAGATQAAGGRSGPIANRTEAIARLNEIADFFNRTEPHSPIGFLISRAASWSQKSFQDVFIELLKGKNDAQEQIWDALGMKPPEHPNS
jgi:type VI secretion system ImpA/VasJ family protein